MAAITIPHSLHHTKIPPKQLYTKHSNTPRSFIPVSCQNKTDRDSTKENNKPKSSLPHQLINLGKNLKENLGPKKKGDWKDLTLMSLSFAVYVYMSQQIVCAYCAWMSMFKHSW